MNFDKSRHHFWFLIHAKKTWSEQISANHVGMFLLWSRLYLTIMLCWFLWHISVGNSHQFLFKWSAIWQSCWFLWHVASMEQTLCDIHVCFWDIFLIWSILYLAIMLVSVTCFFYVAGSLWQSCWFLWHVSPMEQTLSDNHVGMFLLWSKLDLIIMLVSVTHFFYGADSIWQLCWFLWHDSSMA